MMGKIVNKLGVVDIACISVLTAFAVPLSTKMPWRGCCLTYCKTPL